MSAISRKRTRNDARKSVAAPRAGRQFVLPCGVTPSFFERRRRAAVPLVDDDVALYCRSAMPIFVVQKPLAVRSRKLLKNATPWRSSGVGRSTARRSRRARAVRSRVGAGRGTACRSDSGTRRSSQRQAAAHRDLPPRLIDHHEVHELRHAGVGGAAGSLVARDDQIDQHADRRVFVRGEELRLERRRRLRRLRAACAACSCACCASAVGPDERRGDRRRRAAA